MRHPSCAVEIGYRREVGFARSSPVRSRDPRKAAALQIGPVLAGAEEGLQAEPAGHRGKSSMYVLSEDILFTL